MLLLCGDLTACQFWHDLTGMIYQYASSLPIFCLVAKLYSNPFSAWILLAFILFIFLFLHLTKYRPFGNHTHSSPGSINFRLSRDFFFFFLTFLFS